MSGEEVSARTRALMRQKAREQQEQIHSADVAGTAGWCPPEVMVGTGLFEEGLFLMGRVGGRIIRYSGQGHLLTLGPNGSGKSVSSIVPNLLHYPGSVICIDPKGAIPAITARHRHGHNQDVFLLDPFGEVEAVTASGAAGTGRTDWRRWPWIPPRAHFNPFSQLDPVSPDCLDQVQLITASLIPDEEGKNRFFSDSARNVLEALILYTLASQPRSDWTLKSVTSLAYLGAEGLLEKHLEGMLGNQLPDPFLREHLGDLANQIAGFEGNLEGSVWATLHRSLGLLKNARLMETMSRSDFSFAQLKERPTTVYLVLPAQHLSKYGLWLRLMVAQALSALSTARPSEYPVLFLLDECSALGTLEILQTAVGLMRGYGIKLWMLFQDLSQLKRLYPHGWESFLANSGVKQVFNVNDLETAKYISEFVGTETRAVLNQSQSPGQLGMGTSTGYVGRSLLTPDEVRRLGPHAELLLYEGLQPILAEKLRYYDRTGNPEFADLYDPDPYVKEQKGTL